MQRVGSYDRRPRSSSLSFCLFLYFFTSFSALPQRSLRISGHSVLILLPESLLHYLFTSSLATPVHLIIDIRLSPCRKPLLLHKLPKHAAAPPRKSCPRFPSLLFATSRWASRSPCSRCMFTSSLATAPFLPGLSSARSTSPPSSSALAPGA